MNEPDLRKCKCEHTIAGFKLLAEGGKLDQAHSAFKNSVEQDVNNGLGWAGLAIVNRGLGDIEKCRELLDRSLEVAPENTFALLQRCISRARAPYHNGCFQDFLALVGYFASKKSIPPQFYDILTDSIRLPERYLEHWLNFDDNAAGILLEQLCLAETSCASERYASNLAAVRFVLSLLRNKGEFVLSAIEGALSSPDEESFGENIYRLYQALSFPNIGVCSLELLQDVIGRLRDTLETVLTNEMTARKLNAALSLASLIRMENLEQILNARGLRWIDLEDQVLISLLLPSTPEIGRYFRRTKPTSDHSSTPFKQLCWICFAAKAPTDIDQALIDRPELIRALRDLDMDGRNEIMSQVHQAHYNVYIGGHLRQSHFFSYALACINKILFGTYDCFYRDGAGFLNRDWVAAFGHLLYLDLLLNAEKIGLGPKIPRHISCVEEDLANPSIAELLQHNGFTFAKPSKETAEPRRWQMDYVAPPGRSPLHFLNFCNDAQARLTLQKEASYLTLPEEWRREGKIWLEERGIEDGDTVAVMHFRESSYWTNLHNAFMNSRNVDPNAYLLAIRFLMDDGVKVIRMGDARMSPLTGLDDNRLIDLTMDRDFPPFMDFFLLERADVFVGSTSGPSAVANLFQTRCLLSNWFPLNVHIPSTGGQSLIMPKMVRKSQGWAPLSELMQDPISCTEFLHRDADGNDVELVDNSPEEILEAVQELIARHRGTHVAPHDVLEIEKRINTVWQQEIPWPVTMPHCFLRKYGQHLT